MIKHNTLQLKKKMCVHIHIDTHIHFLEASTELESLGKENQELG